MRPYKTLLISTIILFLFINTCYYWEGMLGEWNLLSLVLYALSFLILLICLTRQLYLVIRERLKNKARIYLTVIMIFLLGLIAAKPKGIIDFERFESKDLFIAWREGVANCTTTLKLKENKQFYIRSICFGVTKNSGNYSVKDDTIKFKFSLLNNREKHYEFGIYKAYNHPNGKIIGEIRLYTSSKDTLPYPLGVYKNELINKIEL
jgi:hypothetical protein